MPDPDEDATDFLPVFGLGFDFLFEVLSKVEAST